MLLEFLNRFKNYWDPPNKGKNYNIINKNRVYDFQILSTYLKSLNES